MGQDPARRAKVRGRGLGARQRHSAVPEGDRPDSSRGSSSAAFSQILSAGLTVKVFRPSFAGGDFGSLMSKGTPVVKCGLEPERVLNHRDNFDGSVERGYAGASLWRWQTLPAYAVAPSDELDCDALCLVTYYAALVRTDRNHFVQRWAVTGFQECTLERESRILQAIFSPFSR